MYESPYLAKLNLVATPISEFEEDLDTSLKKQKKKKETFKKSSHRLNVKHFPNCKIKYKCKNRKQDSGGLTMSI